MTLPVPGSSIAGQYVYNETVGALGSTLITTIAANQTVDYNGANNIVDAIVVNGQSIPVTSSFGATQDLTAFTFQNSGALGLLGSTYIVSNTPINGLVSVGSVALLPNNVGLTATQDQYVACYLRGTQLLAPTGWVPVENLSIGDCLATPNGPGPVKWIGRRSYLGRFARGNKSVLPIRIGAGALADGIPGRNLWVSPKHAMLLDGVLIPAEVLVNGTTIVQEHDMETIEYFHVELDRHGILFAEGAQSESFVDDNSRNMFHNAHEHAALYPGSGQVPALYCAPRLENGEQVEAVRRRLELRADPAAQSGHEGLGTLRGTVDMLAGGRLYGWAQHADRPEVAVCLEVLLGDAVVGRTLANRYRADLWHAGIGSGGHAFEIALSEPVLAQTQPHGMRALRVRRAVDGAELSSAQWAVPGVPRQPGLDRAA